MGGVRHLNSWCSLSGGEGFGLSPQLRALCDVLLTIPPRRDLHPGVESLNVSVATGTDAKIWQKFICDEYLIWMYIVSSINIEIINHLIANNK